MRCVGVSSPHPPGYGQGSDPQYGGQYGQQFGGQQYDPYQGQPYAGGGYAPQSQQQRAPELAPKRRRRWPWVVGGLIVLGVLGSTTGGNDQPASTRAGNAAPVAAAPVAPGAAAPVPLPAPTPAVPAEPAGPQMTVSQENAVESAENYLSYSGFSRKGLIKQLEFEEFSTADATFAVDNVDVDWMAEAAESAANYMDYSSFSRSGLIDQLEFEGFTAEQAEHGADSVGL